MPKRTLIPVGPYHPLQEEAEFWQLYVEGETVVDVDVRLGYNHRGIEKLAEGKTYDQVAFLVERICGICSTSHPMAYVNALEDLLGIEPPDRAKYIRTIIAELERIHSHLLWLGLAGHFIGYNTVFMWAWRYREPVLDLFELITGNRNNYAMMKIGGVRRDIRGKDIPQALKTLDEILPAVEMFIGAVMDDPVIHARLKGVGVLKREEAVKYCVVGPTARASGIDIDIRADEPYAAYDRIKWNVITLQEGDVFAKAAVRLLETVESIKMVKQCLENLPDGPISVEVGDIPEGEGIGHAEAPRGEVFHYVRSDGTNRPYRYKVRAPSYVNIPSFKASCIGGSIADVTITLAAVDPCYCCTERVAVYDRKTKERIMDWGQLVKLSQEKTERIRRELGTDSSHIWRHVL